MTKRITVVLLPSLLLAGLALGFGLGTAQARNTAVTCTQVPQKVTGMMIDDAFVAKFMSEQLDAGRTRFETVQGLSTVVCAY